MDRIENMRNEHIPCNIDEIFNMHDSLYKSLD